MDEVGPALSMMRTGTDPSSSGDDDFLFSAPAAPTPSHPKFTASSSSAGLASPVMSSMPIQPLPAFVMSPDDMLRAYTERKAAGANKGFGGGISMAQTSHPAPAANTSTSSGSGGMRTQFYASGVVSPTSTGNGGYDEYGGGASYAIGDEHDEGDVGHDPYGGTS